MAENLTSNMEDYLEAIAVLKEKNDVARVRDISHFLGVEPPSVASALDNLSNGGFVIHERYGYVDLTPRGKKLAKTIKSKHKMFFEFFTKILNIDPVVADEDACKMEHSVSGETFEKLAKFIKFVKTCPQRDKPDWLKSFDSYFKTGKRQKCKIRTMKEEKVAKGGDDY